MAEGNGLLNRRRGKTSTEGSNPSLSATVGFTSSFRACFALKKTMGQQHAYLIVQILAKKHISPSLATLFGVRLKCMRLSRLLQIRDGIKPSRWLEDLAVPLYRQPRQSA